MRERIAEAVELRLPPAMYVIHGGWVGIWGARVCVLRVRTGAGVSGQGAGAEGVQGPGQEGRWAREE